MAEQKVVITKIGLEKIAGATADNPLNITVYAVGDGGGVEITPNEDMTSLVNEKFRTLVNEVRYEGDSAIAECVLAANANITEGFYIRELGLFDEDGNLIAIANPAESYRPALTEGVATEAIWNVVLKVANSENVTVTVNQTVYATVDSLNRLLSRVENLEKSQQSLVEASVGIDKWFNTDDKYKDQKLVTIGVKTWALMDESNVLNIEDYPVLYKNCGATEILNEDNTGTGTFKVPSYKDGTIRHLPVGSSRTLGSYEEDSFKEHSHEITHGHTAGSHDHDMSHEHSYNRANFHYNSGKSKAFAGEAHELYYENIQTTGGRDRTSAATVTINNFEGSSDLVGDTETRMKNTSGQFYILAKINI